MEEGTRPLLATIQTADNCNTWPRASEAARRAIGIFGNHGQFDAMLRRDVRASRWVSKWRGSSGLEPGAQKKGGESPTLPEHSVRVVSAFGFDQTSAFEQWLYDRGPSAKLLVEVHARPRAAAR